MSDFEELLEKYISEGIDFDANTIKNAKVSDLEQLASDSYYQGWEDLKSVIINLAKFMEDYSGREGCYYGDTEYDSLSVVYGYNQALKDIGDHLKQNCT